MVKIKEKMEGEYKKVINESKCDLIYKNWPYYYLKDLKVINKVPKVIADDRILSKLRNMRQALMVSTIKKQCRLNKETVFGLPAVSCQKWTKSN